MKRIYLFLLLLVFPLMYISGSNNYFSIIDGNDGLSQNHVKSIIQDSYGFMWFGSRNRLNRYDGVSIKVFDCYDANHTKGNNNIGVIYEDPGKRLWLGTDNGVFIFDPVTEQFTFFHQVTTSGVQIKEWIADICEDQQNNIWIMVPNQGVFRYEQESGQLFHYSVVEEFQPSVSNPQCIAIEKNGRVWVGTNGSGIFLYDFEKDIFEPYSTESRDGSLLTGKNIYTMCHYNDHLIIGIHEENLLKLDKRRSILQAMNTPQIENTIIRYITLLHEDELWVGTQAGLFIINEKKNSIEHIREDKLNQHALSDNIIETIYEDREGGIWIGTNFGGVNYLPNRYNNFEKYFPTSEKGSLNSRKVREIKEDSKGQIWIGTEDAGVSVFDPESKIFREISGLHYPKTLALMIQESEAWVGYFKNGLNKINYPDYKTNYYSGKEMGLNEESVYALCEDRYGNVWLGNAWGVFRAEKGRMQFRYIESFGLSYIYDIIEDSEGYIWVATMGSGVFQYEQRTNKLIHFTAGGENNLSSNSVSSITEDHKGQIWFSTDRGGICVYNKRDGKFRSYSIEQGLPDDVAYKILEDKYHNLWFGTNQGLVQFNPSTKDIRVFTKEEGLLSNQFNYKSGLVSSSGKLYFGCLEGMIAFNPEEFRENHFVPPVYITKFSVFNEEVESKNEQSPLSKSIIHTNRIKLPYHQANISLDFVSLSYTAPSANRYAYKMENIDNDWVYTKHTHSASYAKLPPGKYTFHVKASNNDGVWNEEGAKLKILITPPWWNSAWAWFIYLLLTAMVLFIASRMSLHKYKKRSREKQVLFEVEKEKELYEAKVNFFIDIAHEIRTPVTLINGPLESIMQLNIPDEKLQRYLSLIEQNTKRLLDLINQLLDFRKVDSHKFLLNFRKANISSLLKEENKRFEQEVSLLGKNLSIRNIAEDTVSAVIDREALTKILNNLFSNAIKYSDRSIEVTLYKDDTYFTIEVTNDGPLIPDELKEKIFEPFFQIKTEGRETFGSGIGLPLARSLAELHEGYLFYTSVSGLNTFVLKLPLCQEELPDSQVPATVTEEYIIEHAETVSSGKHAETILVVEDNADMLHFIADQLEDKYIVERATNGQEAQKILRQKSVDIVISDVMMPEMDGFELCEYIKSNIEYSHIIVILLTAKNDLPSKIKGLEIGSDAYVEKPFSFQYLQTLITSLLNNRKREMELFLKKPFLPIQQSSVNKSHEQFLNKIIEIINENITDPDFNVERLADLLFMSRSSLHRKIKATLDTSPVDFIRLVRLQKAAQLIQEGKYRISEICYLVGINSPSYFAKLFQSQFGMSPKDFEKQCKE